MVHTWEQLLCMIIRFSPRHTCVDFEFEMCILPQVLEALEEIAFKPEFLNTRIEKERKAVLAEAQVGL